jgi:hypothetical protein
MEIRRPIRYLNGMTLVAAAAMLLSCAAALVVAVCLGLALASDAGAAGPAVDGRLTTGFYILERDPGSEGETHHLRLYESLTLNARRVGSPRISLHTQMTYANDLGDGFTDDPRFWVSSAYLNWRHRFGFLHAGRQFVWGGAASGRLDGLRLRAVREGWSVVDLFAGVRSSLDLRDGLDSWSDSHMFGGRWQWTHWRRTELAASFVQMSRAPKPYRAAGVYSEDDYWLHHEVSSLRQRLVGLEASQTISPRMALQGRLDFDLPGKQVRLGELVGRWTAGRAQVSGEYVYRSPYIDANSIFSVIGAANQEAAGRLYLGLGQGMGVFARVTHLFLDGDSGTRGTLGLRAGGGSIGLTAADGYGGDRWALTGFYAWRVHRTVRLRLGSNYGSYHPLGSDGDREDALVGTVGATWQPRAAFDLDAELQGLQNEMVDSDMRLMLRATYRFRTGREQSAGSVLWGDGLTSAAEDGR